MDFLFDLVNQIQFWREKLDKDKSGLKDFIDHLIHSNLSSALKRLIALANAGNSWGYRSRYNFFSFKKEFWGLEFIELLGVDSEIVASQQACADEPNTKITKTVESNASGPVLGKAQGLIIARQKFDELFAIFFEAIERICEEAKGKLKPSIDKNASHEPHLGLFFAFLELFDLARNDFNQISRRHLNFFYKEVLKMKERKADMDMAHLIFQLSPLVETYELEKGMPFTAGDDDKGVEMYFELEKAMVVDNAQVEALHTISLDQIPVKPENQIIAKNADYQVKGINAAPVANSSDGLGEAFQDENNRSWKTVGGKSGKPANLGLLIGAKELFLQEGTRKINVSFTCEKNSLV
ncbi:MAG: hypothetical protein KDD63_12345, partial [Bacteroidetes bacterium]|nr:hypothetical protein [Bacteroidota bacterium]